MEGLNEATLRDQMSLKTRRTKSREVSSRFLSPSSTPSRDIQIPSPNQVHSPLRGKRTSTPPDSRKHRSIEDSSGFVNRGLWPSATITPSSSLSNKNLGTLAEHLGNERLNDYLERKNGEKLSSNGAVFSLSKQRSCSEFSRFENEKEKESAKENNKPVLRAGSLRYTGKLRFPGKSSSSSSSSSLLNKLSHKSGNIAPGRLSVDENALHQKSNTLLDTLELESECSDTTSSTDCNSPAISKGSSQSFRKSGIQVSSKYLQDVNLSNRPRRMNSDSNIEHPVSLDSSPRIKKFKIKNAIKRANSLTGYGSATSQWALSPGRSGSPPMSAESKQRPLSFSSLKPPSSPSRAKGVEKLLNLVDLFKGKKSSSSALGSGDVETVHQLRMLHNRLLQWQYANARAHAVTGRTINQVENNLSCACESLRKLQNSVLHKRLKLQKEKLQMKLDFILLSQIKLLESWGNMEREHISAVSMTKECLHSVVCRVPLLEGAKVDLQAAAIALRHASDLAASIKSMLASFSPSAEKTVVLLSELAETVAQEKLLMEEFLELFPTIATLEIEERSLKGFIIQSTSLQQLQQQQEKPEEIPS